MRVAIHQPNYAPWCGYFAKIAVSDVFIFLGSAQFPQGRSYVYRTRVAKGDEAMWLSVPVRRDAGQSIDEARLADEDWAPKHLRTLHHEYARTQYHDEVMELLTPIYEAPGELLAPLNQRIVLAICDYLGLKCEFRGSSEVPSGATSDDRLIELVRHVGGRTYVSGAGGQNYQSETKFEDAGIDLLVKEYEPVPYEREHGGFIGGLSILDALFHLGPRTTELLRYER